MVDITEVSLSVGSHKLSASSYYRIAEIVVHPEYKEATREHNLALVRTTEPIEFNAETQPVQFVRHEIEDGAMVVAGWGRDADGMVPDTLQYIETKLIDQEKCKEYIKNLNDGEICTINDAGKSACIGDQGGPLLLNDEGVAAILSFTISPQCGIDFPDGYQTLYRYLDWIDSTTAQ